MAEAITAGDLHGPELVSNPDVGGRARSGAWLPKGAFAAYLNQLDPCELEERCAWARSSTP